MGGLSADSLGVPRKASSPEVGESRLRSVRSLLVPRSVALVGATERTRRMVEGVFSKGAPAYVVSRTREQVLGHSCYPAIAELPETPEVAVLLVGHRRVIEAATEAVEAGVRALVVPGVGAEAGREAGGVVAELSRLADEHDAAVLGPNCMGMARPDAPSLWIGSLPESFAPGGVSVVAQSGSVAEGFVALGGRIGFDYVISSGGEVARDAADFTDFLAGSDSTRALGLFLETIRRPAALSEALVACAEAGKPVACLKVGRSRMAARVALAHTGALVGSAEACSAFLSAHGVIEVEDLPELVEVLEVLGRRRRPKGRRMAAVSESGGEAGLLADQAESSGLVVEELPAGIAASLESEFPNFAPAQNPLDAWAVDAAERVFPRSLELLGASGSFDILVAQVDLTQYRSRGDSDWCLAIVRGLVEATRDRDLFPAVVSSQVNDPPADIAAFARDNDVALLRGARAATRSLAAGARWRAVFPPRPGAEPVAARERLPAGTMAEHESANLLEAYGVAFAPRRRAASPAQAVEAACELGFPVVVKADGPAHKSAVGGVFLGLFSADAVENAAGRLGGRVLVARQEPPGLEAICGMQRDPDFGPVLVAGLGGAGAESSGAISRALGPLDSDSADELVASVRELAGEISENAHRKLAEVLVALSRLSVEHREIVSIDVNPLIVRGEDIVAVDALVIVGQEKEELP
ncbi:MAG: acetate--CoA ligase family protein [Acidimicrobiales bacterium]